MFLPLYLLDKASIRANLINPKKIKNYSRVMISVPKTDTKDACLIADFGERFHPEPYKFPPLQILILKQKKTVLRQLQKQLAAARNLQQSLEPLPVKDKKCLSRVAVLCLDIDSMTGKEAIELVRMRIKSEH